MTEAESASDSWAVSATDSWPAPPSAAVADTPPTEPEPELDETIETTSGDDSDAAAANQAGRAAHEIDGRAAFIAGSIALARTMT